MTPRKHAAAMHAYADGADIQWRAPQSDSPVWHDVRCAGPSWLEGMEYRVKPAEPAKVYPTTLLTAIEAHDAFTTCFGVTAGSGLLDVANAALRSAIDAQQVVPMAEVQEAAEKMRQHFAARELAIASAVDAVYCTLVPFKQRNSDEYLRSIIASIK